ncbi:MAG: glutaredoxin family protein [Ignavibacteria bacterium]|nr:glutaredoxin family protein [Bacteroidota bacterium]MSQ46022.1 glutaredoxin family protein [Ignavibacteria bacterium]
MKNVTLFSKEGCQLCEIAETIITKLQNKIQFNFTTNKIDSQHFQFENYKNKFPVILIENVEVMSGRVSEPKLRELLLK